MNDGRRLRRCRHLPCSLMDERSVAVVALIADDDDASSSMCDVSSVPTANHDDWSWRRW